MEFVLFFIFYFMFLTLIVVHGYVSSTIEIAYPTIIKFISKQFAYAIECEKDKERSDAYAMIASKYCAILSDRLWGMPRGKNETH